MKTRARVLLTTATVGVPAFLLGYVLFPGTADTQTHSAARLPFFLLFGAAESLALGLGVAFVLFGWTRILNGAGRSGPRRRWALAACLSVTWLLVSWWPHDNLYRQIGGAQGAPYLEYGFQVSLMACGAILAYSLLHHDPLLKEVRQMTRIV